MNTYRIISFVLLMAALFGFIGCSNTPNDAVSGYDMDWIHTRYIEHPLPKAITDDVQKFVQSEKIPRSDISEVTFGQDKSGRHVAMIMQEIPASQGKELKVYVIYYNKENIRTSSRKFHAGRSC